MQIYCRFEMISEYLVFTAKVWKFPAQFKYFSQNTILQQNFQFSSCYICFSTFGEYNATLFYLILCITT